MRYTHRATQTKREPSDVLEGLLFREAKTNVENVCHHNAARGALVVVVIVVV